MDYDKRIRCTCGETVIVTPFEIQHGLVTCAHCGALINTRLLLKQEAMNEDNS